jgi:hypothetical protein
LESEIDKAAAKIWGVTAEHLKAIVKAVADSRKSEGASEEEEDER